MKVRLIKPLLIKTKTIPHVFQKVLTGILSGISVWYLAFGYLDYTKRNNSRKIFILPLLFVLSTTLNAQTTQTFTSSTTWTVPAGVTQITVEAWGAGGGGGTISGGNTTGTSRGGGGGAYSRKEINSIIPGNDYIIVVGVGGITGADGGYSFFGTETLVKAAGGKAGNGNTSGAGGLGGTVAESVGDIIYRGGNAVAGGGGGAGSIGQGGDATGNTGGTVTAVNGGNGGNAPISGNNPGNNGSNYGGGGSGANKAINGSPQNGGSGGNGLIIVSWCLPPSITTQPVNQTVTYDSNAIFTVGSNDSNISTYQWQVNDGNGWVNIGTNGAAFTVNKPEVNMTGYLYRCIVTNNCGSFSTSNIATLTVNPRVLTVTAGDQTVTYGTHDGDITENGTFSITGFVNGDNSSVISGLNSISYSTTYTETTNAGSTGITISPVITGLSAINYSFSAANGTISITKADQFISCNCVLFTKPLNEFDTIYIDATSSSGLPLTITIEPGSAATLNGSPGNYFLTDIGETGSVTLYANQAGNINYNPADQGTRYFDVTKSNQNISFPSIDDVNFYNGLNLQLNAIATSGLTVSYTVVSGSATVAGNILTITGAGEIWVRADQAGDANYNATASVLQSFTVNKGTQTITINVPAEPLTESTQISATSTSGLPVTLTLGTGSAATDLVDHGSYYTLTGIGGSGNIYFVGNQTGNDNFLPALQIIDTIDVSKANQVITFNSIGNKIYGDSPVTLSATASSGLTVSFTIISGSASLVGNVLSFTGAGTVIIEANQAGNGSYNPAPSVTQQFEIIKATPVIVQLDIVKTYGDPDFTITPSSNSTGSFSFISGNDEVFTIISNTATIVGAGNTALDITQQPTANYFGVIKTVLFTVNKANSAIFMTGSQNYTYNGSHQGPETSTITGSTGVITYSYEGIGATIFDPGSVKPTNSGTYQATATVAEDDNYLGATSLSYAFTISKADATIDITPYSVNYDGNLHTSIGSAEGVLTESLAGLDLTGTTHTDAGIYNSDLWTFTDVTGNYNDVSGTISNIINPKALSITASNQLKCAGDDFIFGGTEFSSTGLVGTETIGTVDLSSTGANSGAAAGNYPIVPSNATGGTFNLSNYNIVYNNGNLIVKPLPTLTGASQKAVNCEGSTTTINLVGLLTEKIFSLNYTINGMPQSQITGLYSDVSGNSSFTTPVLSNENNNQVLQITGITITSDAPNCTQTFAVDVILKVTLFPTLTGASQVETVCEGTNADISLTGLIAGSTFTIYYSIDGIDQVPVEELTADETGNSVFSTVALTASNDGQILQITGLEITDNSSSCYQAFAQDITLSVNPVSVGGTATASENSICENDNTTISLSGYTGTIQWQQSIDGSTGWNDVTGGSGDTTDTYITPNLTATTFYRAVVTSDVCNSANSNVVKVTVNTLPEIGSFN